MQSFDATSILFASHLSGCEISRGEERKESEEEKSKLVRSMLYGLEIFQVNEKSLRIT